MNKHWRRLVANLFCLERRKKETHKQSLEKQKEKKNLAHLKIEFSPMCNGNSHYGTATLSGALSDKPNGRKMKIVMIMWRRRHVKIEALH